MRKIPHGALAFWFATLLSFQPAHAAEPLPRPMWIIGSYVNIHNAPDDKAPVLAHLTTNAKVTLAGESARYCEVSWGDTSHGYVVCRFLAGQPLQLSDVERTEKNQNDTAFQESPLRAFWIEPSFGRLRAAGQAFEATMLPGALAKKEAGQFKAAVDAMMRGENPKAGTATFSRFPIPEFEAMKALAKNGMQPPPITKPLYPEISTIHPNGYTDSISADYLPLFELLPAVKPSRFNAEEQIGAMQATTDTLSALFQIPYRVETESKPYAAIPHYNDPFIFGSWDMGDAKLSLVRPVHDVGIYRDGHVVTLATRLEQHDVNEPDAEATPECGSFAIEAHMAGDAGEPYIVSRLPAKGMLMYFRTPAAIDAARAQVRLQQIDIETMKPALRDTLRANQVQVVNNYTITLQGDTAPDFAVLELGGYADVPGKGNQPGTPIYPTTRYYFVNIAGHWHLLDADALQGCS